MSGLKHRLTRLEEQMGRKEDRLVLRIMRAGQTLALSQEACDQILEEAGFFGPILDFLDVPQGLTAKELETYLRKHGDEICGARRHQS